MLFLNIALKYWTFPFISRKKKTPLKQPKKPQTRKQPNNQKQVSIRILSTPFEVLFSRKFVINSVEESPEVYYIHIHIHLLKNTCPISDEMWTMWQIIETD